MKQKMRRWSASFFALLLCMTLLASTAFAAGGALGADRNGTPYTYVIGYMYSGSSQTVNTREIFTSPNNYDIWLCPVCGRDPVGNSQGTALAADLYMPCYGYDIAAAGGDMSIRYALVRHRHNNGQLSDDRVYIPVNVPMYAGCYYGYDLTRLTGYEFWFALPESGFPNFYYAADMWQYSFTESVPGIGVETDMNLWFIPKETDAAEQAS